MECRGTIKQGYGDIELRPSANPDAPVFLIEQDEDMIQVEFTAIDALCAALQAFKVAANG